MLTVTIRSEMLNGHVLDQAELPVVHACSFPR